MLLRVSSFLLAQYLASAQVISVFGSAVANGAGCAGNCSGVESPNPGGCYQSLLKQLQATKGRSVFNNCNNGDTSDDLIARFAQVLAVKAKYVLIALSLDSEGVLGADPGSVAVQYENNLKTLVNMSRVKGIFPVIGLSYPNNVYTNDQYKIVKVTNFHIQSWDVPSINFLGALDDGKGRWIPDYSLEASLPNEAGSTFMYHTIVPSLWDAIDARKAIPVNMFNMTKAATLSCSNGISGYSKLSFTPVDSAIFSWTMTFTLNPDFATGPSGTFATVACDHQNFTANFSLDRGKFAYGSLLTNVSLDDAVSHQVSVVHSYPAKNTKVYVDGVLMGQVTEQLQPTEFAINGGSCITYPIQLSHWMIHRSALNADDVSVMFTQNIILPASLEIYDPLDESNLVDNLACSMATVEGVTIVPTASVAPTTDAPTRSPTTDPAQQMAETNYDAQIAIFALIMLALIFGLIGWKLYKCHQRKRVGAVEPQQTEME